MQTHATAPVAPSSYEVALLSLLNADPRATPWSSSPGIENLETHLRGVSRRVGWFLASVAVALLTVAYLR
jgi:hypothetical protein